MEGKKKNSANLTLKTIEPVNCETGNCVYMIEFNNEKCKQRYIGGTERSLAKLIQFHQSEQSVYDVRITILDKMKTNDASYRKEGERYLIATPLT